MGTGKQSERYMMSVDPKQMRVSVIIPAHNCRGTLERAVNSVLAQTFSVHEILIYDDGSSDGTRELAKEISRQTISVKAFGSTSNRGAGFARRFLLDQASGEFAAFLDADDAWHPIKLEMQMPEFIDPMVGICVSGYNLLSYGRHVGYRNARCRFGLGLMHLSNLIGMSTAVVRLALDGSRTMPMIRKRQDYAYWLSLLRMNPYFCVSGIDQDLVDYHIQSNSLSRNKFDNLKWNFLAFRIAMGYGPVRASFFTFLNVIFRILRPLAKL